MTSGRSLRCADGGTSIYSGCGCDGTDFYGEERRLSETEFEKVCKRCLKDTEKVGTTQVIEACERCGTENWCFEVPRAKSKKKAAKGAKIDLVVEDDILGVTPILNETEAESVDKEIEEKEPEPAPELPEEKPVVEETPPEAVSKPSKREALIAQKKAELEELEKLE